MWQHKQHRLSAECLSRHHPVSFVLEFQFWIMSKREHWIWFWVEWHIVCIIKHLSDLAQSQPVWKFFARKGKTLSTWDLTPKFASLNPCNVVFCCRRRSRCIVDKCLYTMFHFVSMSCFSKCLSSCRVSDDFYLSLIRKTFQFTVFSEHLQKKQLKFTSHHVPQAWCQPGEWESTPRMRYFADEKFWARQAWSDPCVQGWQPSSHLFQVGCNYFSSPQIFFTGKRHRVLGLWSAAGHLSPQSVHACQLGV